MDHNGDVRSVFFYTDPENPYFDLEEAREGMVFTFQSPNLRPPRRHHWPPGSGLLQTELVGSPLHFSNGKFSALEKLSKFSGEGTGIGNQGPKFSCVFLPQPILRSWQGRPKASSPLAILGVQYGSKPT